MKLRYSEMTSDLINHASHHTVLVHGSNCVGSASAGVALAIKKAFPSAVAAYTEYCRSHTPELIVGQAFISTIPLSNGKEAYLANLLTSKHYGRKKDTPTRIVKQTHSALKNLKAWIEQKHLEDGVKIYSPKFNAGLFAVPWVETEKAIKRVFGEVDGEWTVVVREEDKFEESRKTTKKRKPRGLPDAGDDINKQAKKSKRNS